MEQGEDVAPTLLLDTEGKEIPLVRGRTFFQVVPNGTKVTHRAGSTSPDPAAQTGPDAERC